MRTALAALAHQREELPGSHAPIHTPQHAPVLLIDSASPDAQQTESKANMHDNMNT